VKKTVPRDSLFIVCSLLTKNELWIIPSKVFYEKSVSVKGTRDKEYVRLNIGREGSATYEELRTYRDNFVQLTQGATSRVKKELERASRIILEKHLTQSQAELKILQILSNSKSVLSTREIVKFVKEMLERDFTKADLQELSHGRLRWEVTTRFAIYQGLKKKNMIESKGKNQWVITDKGLEYFRRDPGL